MKKVIFLFLLLPFLAKSQHMSCCKTSTMESFAQLSSSDEFASFHLAPLPLDYSPTLGSMITFTCNDGSVANAFEIKQTKPTNKWLFVFHEWWGLNDYIKREAENFAGELGDVNVLAIDLYDGQIAEDPTTAQKIMESITDDRARSIIRGAIKHTGDKARIGTVGWCFGGGWSLQASLMAGKQATACAIYYGMPENDVEKLKKLNCDVYGIYALQDKWLTPEIVKTFEKNMRLAGKKITVKSYAADHAFANPSNPKYDVVAADEAHKLVIVFLRNRFSS